MELFWVLVVFVGTSFALDIAVAANAKRFKEFVQYVRVEKILSVTHHQLIALNGPMRHLAHY